MLLVHVLAVDSCYVTGLRKASLQSGSLSCPAAHLRVCYVRDAATLTRLAAQTCSQPAGAAAGVTPSMAHVIFAKHAGAGAGAGADAAKFGVSGLAGTMNRGFSQPQYSCATPSVAGALGLSPSCPAVTSAANTNQQSNLESKLSSFAAIDENRKHQQPLEQQPAAATPMVSTEYGECKQQQLSPL